MGRDKPAFCGRPMLAVAPKDGGFAVGAPEQARGEGQITSASDPCSFEVILYETLTGDVPIRAEDDNQLMYPLTIGGVRERTRHTSRPALLLPASWDGDPSPTVRTSLGGERWS